MATVGVKGLMTVWSDGSQVSRVNELLSSLVAVEEGWLGTEMPVAETVELISTVNSIVQVTYCLVTVDSVSLKTLAGCRV